MNRFSPSAIPDRLLHVSLLLCFPLGLLVLGWCLPDGLPGTVLRLVLVAAALGVALNILRSAAMAFAFASLATLILFREPLGTYTEILYKQAGDLTVFMIILFGGTLFLASRQDLLELLEQRRQDRRENSPNTALRWPPISEQLAMRGSRSYK